MRVALYLRVSTGEQTVEPQRRELLDYCERRGWSGPTEYADTISGAKFTRSGLDALMAAVRSRRVDVVLCVKLDRLGRSLQHLALLIGELDTARVALICTSQGIDTSTDNPAGRLQLGVLMAVAEFERSLIRERTKAGLAAARARGSIGGRRRFLPSEEQKRTLAAFLDARRGPRVKGETPTFERLAEQLGCSIGMAHRLAASAMRPLTLSHTDAGSHTGRSRACSAEKKERHPHLMY